ncbi:MAG: GMC family oxidoreductase N-terminal domain-containing protein [Candidatus Omnitrophica bacterium]|nr:GMC family oxidoreductase N-terminal domain-containing protein [Candidatus Omnitrophota bacterium]
MQLKTDIVIVGSGAGGATMAKELAGTGRKVLVVERGPMPKDGEIGTLRSAVLNFYDRCALRTSKEGTIIYRALMAGGTTIVSCGNGMRVLENELKKEGVDLTQEFEETEKEMAIAPLANNLIGRGSRLIMDSANRLGFNMVPMPKYIDSKKCVSCGKCVLGCPYGAKWTALSFLKSARRSGAKFIPKINIQMVATKNGRAIGLIGKSPKGRVRIYADTVILAGGGIGTPVILKNSGIENAGNKLFADMFNVTYGVLKNKNTNLWREPTMAVVSTKYMKEKGILLSPFIDVPLVLRWVMSKRKQLKNFRYTNLLGIMNKTRDDNVGLVTAAERFEKAPTISDMKRLNEGARMSAEILIEAGVHKNNIIYTKPRAAHPGGSAAIGEIVDSNLQTSIKGLYVCDASVLPTSPGAPPIVTIVSLAKRLSKHLKKA